MTILGLIIAFNFSSFSQQITVTGIVTDDKDTPLPGVKVVEKGTNNGALTDFDGKYTLALTSEKPSVVFKFVGYRDKTVVFTGAKINHQMKVDAIGLDAVVVSASKRKERILVIL